MYIIQYINFVYNNYRNDKLNSKYIIEEWTIMPLNTYYISLVDSVDTSYSHR